MIAPAMGIPHGLCEAKRARIVIYCFFDDSGKESATDNEFVVMAGLMTNYWEMFDVRWQQLLLKYDLPYVHIKESLNMAKDKGWDMLRLHAVLGEFATVIRESNLVGIGVGVHLSAWKEIPKSLRDRLGDAQVFCCSRVVRRIMDRLDTVGLRHERITLIFDQDFGFARHRLRLFEDLKKLHPPIRERVAQVSFADSRTFYPLQGADMLAWDTRRELVNRSGGRESTRRWKALTAALPSGQIDFAVGEFWTKEWFEQEIPKLLGPDWQSAGA